MATTSADESGCGGTGEGSAEAGNDIVDGIADRTKVLEVVVLDPEAD
jgi:hypothetical protein